MTVKSGVSIQIFQLKDMLDKYDSFTGSVAEKDALLVQIKKLNTDIKVGIALMEQKTDNLKAYEAAGGAYISREYTAGGAYINRGYRQSAAGTPERLAAEQTPNVPFHLSNSAKANIMNSNSAAFRSSSSRPRVFDVGKADLVTEMQTLEKRLGRIFGYSNKKPEKETQTESFDDSSGVKSTKDADLKAVTERLSRIEALLEQLLRKKPDADATSQKGAGMFK